MNHPNPQKQRELKFHPTDKAQRVGGIEAAALRKASNRASAWDWFFWEIRNDLLKNFLIIRWVGGA